MSAVDRTRSLLLSSDESFRNVCGPCSYDDTQEEATHYCNSCQELLCVSCTEAHKKMKISRNHALVSVSNVSKQLPKSSGVSSQVLCDCGQNLIVVEYCEDHEDIICIACKTLRHRRCKTTPVDIKSKDYSAENLALVAGKVKMMTTKIEELLKNRNTLLKKIITMKEDCKNEIRSFRNELNAVLDVFEQNSLKEIETLEVTEKSEIEHQLSVLATTKQMLHTDNMLLQHANKSPGKTDMFSTDVKISKHLKDYEAVFQDFRQETNLPIIRFERNKELTDMKGNMKSLGLLSTSVEKDCVASLFLSRTKDQEFRNECFLNSKIDSVSRTDVRMQDDKTAPCISGCVVLSDDQVLQCDYSNDRLKVLSNDLTIKYCLDLPTKPWDVSMINNNSVIITLPEKEQLQVIQLTPSLKTGRILQLDEKCWGVAVAGEEIYVTCFNTDLLQSEGEVRCLDMEGNLKRRVGADQDASYMFSRPFYLTVSQRSGKIYISDYFTSTVTCIMPDGSVVYQYGDPDSRCPRGVIVDDEDNIIVCCELSNTVQIVTAAGKKCKPLISKPDIESPRSIAYRHSDRSLIVGRPGRKMLLIFKLAR